VPTTGNHTGSEKSQHGLSQDHLLNRIPLLAGKSAQAKFLAEHPELLNSETISRLADLVRDQSKINTAKAIPIAQLAMAIAAKLKDRPSLARSWRAMGNALYVSGDNLQAVAYHDKARKTFAALRNRRELARTLSASTQPLILTGNYQRALSNAKQARRMLLALRESGRVARLDVNIGNIFHRQDRFAEALRWYRRAHRNFLTHSNEDAEGLAVALHNVAVCLVSLNDFHGALAAHEQARTIAQQHGMHILVDQADYNIAALHHLRGEHSRAIAMLLSTREACKKTDDRYHVSLCQLDLSEIYLQLNLSGPAAQTAQEAAEGFQKLGMGYEAGKSLVNLALAKAAQGELAEASQLLMKARREFVIEKNSVWPYLIDLYQADIMIAQGRHREAQWLSLAANRVFKRARIPSVFVQGCLLQARSCLLSQKLEAANRHCSLALASLEKIELPALASRAQQLMGQIHLAGGSGAGAYKHFDKARLLLEKTRAGLHNEELKISFVKDKLEIYEGLVQLCLDRSPGTPDFEKAFAHIEQSKSRSLQDLISHSQDDVSDLSADGENHRRAIDLRAEINWYSRKLAQEQLRGAESSQSVIVDLRAAIRKRENEMLRLVREMPPAEAISEGLASSEPANLAEIRVTLPPDSTLIEYFQIQDRLLAAVLTPEQLRILPVAQMTQVAPLIEMLQFQLSKFRLGPEYLNTFGDSLLQTAQQHLKNLHDQLFLPLREHLEGQHLVIVPHGRLHRLPFQALFDGRDYLADQFTISYAPSATIHALCHKRSVNRRGPALVMGVADEAAPLMRDEAVAVAEIIPGSELFLDDKATAAVLQKKGSQARIIHIAAHGHFQPDSPMFSGIRLGDSTLNLLDLYRFKLPAELITFSGCATGVSQVAEGDELLGLVRGLIYAGAGAMLLTLWDVPDSSTLEFMTSFYRHLVNGAKKAVALQNAARSVRENYPHPYYWAPFSLVGNPSAGY
jgi:CHAT domain-containing protein